MQISIRPRAFAAAAALAALFPISVLAQSAPPHGVWIDDTGRGGVEIKDCGGKLCGHVVWVKDPKFSNTCGTQIIGDAIAVGESVWDNGWIYSPEKKSKFDVEVTPVGADKLQVTGYMGTKIFSKTMIWTRAPADIIRCSTPPLEAAAPKKSEKAPSATANASADPAAAVVTAKPKTPAPPVPAAVASQEAAPDVKPDVPKPDVVRGQAVAPKVKQAPAEKVARAEPSQKRTPSRRERCTIDVPYFTMSYPCDDD